MPRVRLREAVLIPFLAPWLLLACPAPASARTLLPENPIFDGADPSALVEHGTVWLYPTAVDGQLFAWSSRDLVHWTRSAALLARDDIAWVRDDPAPHGLWAPHMARVHGRYYLYYSVGPQNAAPSRIGVATCEGPAGPCQDIGHPLIDGADSASFHASRAQSCPDDTPPTGNGRFGFEAIDPMVFVDRSSKRALLYAGGSNGSTLRVWELAPDMVNVAAEFPVEQPPCFTEGVWMFRRKGLYYLSYSSGNFRDVSYSVRYATSPTATGPWTYRGALLRSSDRYKGPGHHGFFRDPRTGEWYIVYHSWGALPGDGPYSGSRKVALARVRFDRTGVMAVSEIDNSAAATQR